jgi:hypothetical protein
MASAAFSIHSCLKLVFVSTTLHTLTFQMTSSLSYEQKLNTKAG